MNKREAMIRAHRVTALLIRSYLDNAESLADDESDADKVEAALLELAVRHESAEERMLEKS
jgi:hypothetical protein